MKGDLLFAKPGVIVAADVNSFEALRALVRATCAVPGIIGYKIGYSLGLRNLKEAADIIREYCGDDVLIIYDHQKAGTDIPDTGVEFAKVMAEAKVHAAILFPLAGPVTEVEWIKALKDEGIIPIVGGEMTHKGFLAKDGGFIADDAPERIYRIAIDNGVRNFVIPGNKLESVAKYIKLFDGLLGKGNYTVIAPGFITQGGLISDFAKLVEIWGAIVGRGIYAQSDMNEAAWIIVGALGYECGECVEEEDDEFKDEEDFIV
jgi:orotidine-5'-phosphate decarboxylase